MPVAEFGDELVDCHILYPDPTPLITSAAERCASRRNRKNMVNAHQLDSWISFAWARHDSTTRHWLFQIRHSDPKVAGHYQYVNV